MTNLIVEWPAFILSYGFMVVKYLWNAYVKSVVPAGKAQHNATGAFSGCIAGRF
jgi:hypothetical protein